MIKCINCDAEYRYYDELERKDSYLCTLDGKAYYEDVWVCPHCGRDEFDEIKEDEE